MPQSRKGGKKPPEEPQEQPVEQPALEEGADSSPSNEEPKPDPIEGEIRPVEEGPLAGWELPTAGDLVAIDKADAYRAMDRADEAQILAEIEGRALDVMLYSFRQGNQDVTDLSYAGVRECVRTLNQRGLTSIRVASEPRPEVNEITEDGEAHYQVAVYAEDTRNGGGQWGVAQEPKRMKLTEAKARQYREAGREVDADGKVWDKFALSKAMNKAQRNAMKALVPLELQQALIALLKKQPERVQRIHMGVVPDELQKLPPAIGPDHEAYEEAERLRAAAREVFQEIRAVHPTKYLVPGAFNQMLMRHEWSIERLHELIQTLQGIRDRARQEEQEPAPAAAK